MVLDGLCPKVSVEILSLMTTSKVWRRVFWLELSWLKTQRLQVITKTISHASSVWTSSITKWTSTEACSQSTHPLLQLKYILNHWSQLSNHQIKVLEVWYTELVNGSPKITLPTKWSTKTVESKRCQPLFNRTKDWSDHLKLKTAQCWTALKMNKSQMRSS